MKTSFSPVFDRLKASYDTLCVLDGDKDSINCARQEAIRMVRVIDCFKRIYK